MIELVLIILCCWQLYKLAEQRQLSGWKWIGNFISGYFLFGVVLAFGLVYVYGAEAMKNFETVKEKIAPWLPYTLLFLVFWFLFIRSRILKYEHLDEEKPDDNFKPSQPDKKKDLSYFR